MSFFLSPAWLEQLTVLAGGDLVGANATAIQHLITGGPNGNIAFVTEIDGGHVRARMGINPAAVATLTLTYATALGLHHGALTCRDAFLGGLIRMRGDMRRTIEAAAGLPALFSVLTPLHPRRVDA